jgi:hypothetical protein
MQRGGRGARAVRHPHHDYIAREMR